MSDRIKWTDKTDEDINLVEVFILADRIHQWIVGHESETRLNYLTLTCLHGYPKPEKWAASFDSIGDSEWYEKAEQLPFAASGACVEEAIYRAALKVKNYIESEVKR